MRMLRRLSVDAVVESLKTAIEDLGAISQVQMSHALSKERQIVTLQNEVVVHEGEAQRATRVRERIAALIE